MKINFYLKKMVQKIYKNSNKIFEANIKDDVLYLESFPKPKDNLERSYFQYKCQMSRLKWFIRLLQTVASFILLLFIYLKFFLFNKKTINIKENNKAIFISSGISKEIIPKELFTEYDDILTSSYNVPLYFGIEEIKFIKVLVSRFWFAPYFLYKNILKIGIYSFNIKEHSPKAIITYNEYSFTSSLLTEYCQIYEIENINIMHGEKLFNIRDSFVKFSRYYVWDEHYKFLLIHLRADKKQFKLSTPNSIKLNLNFYTQPKFDLTYYLGDESKENLMKIKDNLDILKKQKFQIKIRFHPRYSDKNDIVNLFNGYSIEDPKEIPLKDSLENTKGIISLYSTVLFQGYKNGKNIIIDDVTNPIYYEKLKELNYIILSKEHQKLSEYIL